MKRELLESLVSAVQANESIARYVHVSVCVLNVQLVVCVCVYIYAFVSRSNQPIFLSQSCHHWNPFEVVPKQQVPPCALISYTRIQILSRSLTHTNTYTHTIFQSV